MHSETIVIVCRALIVDSETETYTQIILDNIIFFW